MSRVEITPDEEMFQPLLSPDTPMIRAMEIVIPGVFVEYRLERDRVRGQEMEMLNKMINNPQVGAEARLEAEQQLLHLVNLMEKELIVENMLKAQGYKDALCFPAENYTVMIEAEKLDAEDFLRIAEMVAATIEISREEVQVIQHK